MFSGLAKMFGFNESPEDKAVRILKKYGLFEGQIARGNIKVDKNGKVLGVSKEAIATANNIDKYYQDNFDTIFGSKADKKPVTFKDVTESWKATADAAKNVVKNTPDIAIPIPNRLRIDWAHVWDIATRGVKEALGLMPNVQFKGSKQVNLARGLSDQAQSLYSGLNIDSLIDLKRPSNSVVQMASLARRIIAMEDIDPIERVRRIKAITSGLSHWQKSTPMERKSVIENISKETDLKGVDSSTQMVVRASKTAVAAVKGLQQTGSAFGAVAMAVVEYQKQTERVAKTCLARLNTK